ncbi:MAG: hypothetical protein RQ757_03520 [Pseudomonadales bacterium]|nr:hypothetical protein [Pseudomonadales bacterium]
MKNWRKQNGFLLTAVLLAFSLHAGSVSAQPVMRGVSSGHYLDSLNQRPLTNNYLDDILVNSESPASQGFNLTRNNVLQAMADGSIGDAVSVNLELKFSPFNGLDLSAGAWQLNQNDSKPLGLAVTEPADLFAKPRLFIEDNQGIALEQPFSALPAGESRGLDLSASYVWESPRFGQLIVSTKASYIYDYRFTDSFRETGLTPVNELPQLVANPEVKSSLTLTWKMGNHTASAVTHYVDSFEEINNFSLEQFDALVDDLTTLDFQYGYSLKAGKQGSAVFSVGIRNVLDRKTPQFTESGRVSEPGGRMAYGTIKYQF